MDAMVTARMPIGKKEAGNAILQQLGMSASQVINELYDYIISNRATPFGDTGTTIDEHTMRDAYAFVDSLPKVELEHKYLTMDAQDVRHERLASLMGTDSEEP